MEYFLYYVCRLLLIVELILHHVFEFLVSIKLEVLHDICRFLIIVELILHHVFEFLVSIELEVLHHICRFLVNMVYSFSIIDLSAYASLGFPLFSFNIFDFLAIDTSIYQFFVRVDYFLLALETFRPLLQVLVKFFGSSSLLLPLERKS